MGRAEPWAKHGEWRGSILVLNSDAVHMQRQTSKRFAFVFQVPVFVF